MNRENIKKELNEIAPKLSEMEKPDVLKVPKGYFEMIPGEVMERIGPPKTRVRTIAVWQRYAAAATVALLLVAGGIWMFQEAEPASVEYDLASIGSEEIDSYLVSQLDDLDESLLVEFADADAMSLELGVDETDLDEFILEDIDLETLNEEYL